MILEVSGNFVKDDLRVAKTYKVLQSALAALLKRRKFKQITINDLCEEALISRAAFYMHFKDKYDLLESWLKSLLTECNAIDFEDFICYLAYDNSKTMQNIIHDAEDETLSILHDFIHFLLDKFFRTEEVKEKDSDYMLFITFCGGGIYEVILSLIKNQNPQQSKVTKQYLHDLLKNLFDFQNKIYLYHEEY